MSPSVRWRFFCIKNTRQKMSDRLEMKKCYFIYCRSVYLTMDPLGFEQFQSVLTLPSEN